MSIPKLSTPLAKLIRTGEGVLLYAFNAALILLPALNDLPWAKAIPWLAITNAVAFASRTFLKAVAVGKPLVGADPIAVNAPQIDQVLAEIGAIGGAQAKVQAAPGIPAQDVKAGLAPDEGPVKP